MAIKSARVLGSHSHAEKARLPEVAAHPTRDGNVLPTSQRLTPKAGNEPNRPPRPHTPAIPQQPSHDPLGHWDSRKRMGKYGRARTAQPPGTEKIGSRMKNLGASGQLSGDYQFSPHPTHRDHQVARSSETEPAPKLARIRLTRTTTIARQTPVCPFRLKVTVEEPQADLSGQHHPTRS